MELKLHKNNDVRFTGKLLSCGFALLMVTGCAAAPSGVQGAEAQLPVTGLSAEVTPVETLPAPVNPGGNPDTQPITVPPTTATSVKYTKVKCGSATMDIPTSLSQVSQYGSGDITTDYASSDGKTKLELECRARRATDDPNTDFTNTKNGLTITPDYTYNKNNRWVVTGKGSLCAGCGGTTTSEYYKAQWYSNDKVFSMLWEYPTADHKSISSTINHVYYSFKWNGSGTPTPVAPGQTQQPAPVTPVAPGQTQQPIAPVAPGQTQRPVAPIPSGPTATTTVKLALREGPDCGSARLAWIPKGTTVAVERAAVGAQAGWYLVTYQGQTGWASGHYLDGSTITYSGPKLCEN